MAKKLIIDSFIGDGAYSKQFVRQMLGEDPEETEVNISSLGGNVDHALNIHDQFASHGNIIINYTGFNASSATVIGLGAKKTKMSENSFYLIHKVMSWVDEFGYMNEDDIESLIEKLSKEKNENGKITLQLAGMYSKKSGKGVKEILNLMKKETWLTASEARDWGFVDEVYSPGKKENFLEDSARVAMIAAAGFPLPERKASLSNLHKNTEEEQEKLLNRFVSKLSSMFNQNPQHKNIMKKQYVNINKALAVEKLDELTEAHLDSIDARLNTLTQAEADRVKANENLIQVNDALNSLDESVKTAEGTTAKIDAIKKLLNRTPGAKSASIDPEGNDEEDEAYDAQNAGFWERFNHLKPNRK